MASRLDHLAKPNTPKPKPWLKPALIGASIGVLLIGGGVWGWITFNNSLQERLDQASAKREAEQVAWERELREREKESLEAREKLWSSKAGQRPNIQLKHQANPLSEPASTSSQTLPPLTEQQLQECRDVFEGIVRLKGRDGGGFNFESDRNKALASKEDYYSLIGCDATPERRLQNYNRTIEERNKAVEGILPPLPLMKN